MEFLNEAFDEFFSGMSLFGYKPMRLVFNSAGIKDMSPYKFIKTDKGYKCLVKTLGINEKDIEVTVEDYGIKVNGKSEVEGDEYNTEIQIAINETVMDNLKEINYHSINGLTVVEMIIENQRKTISINRK
jgi:HSP20 family molecular chaperone IbpA